MFDIIFIILKAIGIILAIILGIIIILLLTILLVPIRYGIVGKKDETIQLEVKVSWLLRILYCKISFIENQLIIKFRIFGKIFYDSSGVKREKRTKKYQRKAKVRRKQNKELTVRNQTEKVNEIVEKSTETIVHGVKEEAEQFLNRDSSINEIGQKENKVFSDKKEVSENKTVIDEPVSEVIDPITIDQKNKKSGFFHKIKAVWLTLIHIPIKIKNAINKLIHSIKEVILKINLLWKKWERIRFFYETNKIGIVKVWYSIKKLLKHIYPRKLSAEIEFGTDDPATTGQVLGVIAVFYGYYGNTVQILPNFNEEILQGQVYCKGRIRLFTLLIICIKLIIDKNFRLLIKNFNTFKEEL
jgi:hypothetical protein